MRKVFVWFSFFWIFQFFGQNNVGIGTTTPHASALLDLTATDKGILIPRVALVAANNGTTPVNNPATGLLVYNTGTGGLTPAGFYYWNGTQWVQIDAGGGSSCVTLDQAYNCGGNGAGRTINALYGSVTINVTAASTSSEGLKVSIANGTSTSPTVGVDAEHTAQHGVAIAGATTAANNFYSAIQGSSNANNTNATIFPGGVSGYFDGTGIGVGVWGETNGTISGAGTGAGVYGYATGNKNFGGKFYGSGYPGADISTGSASAAALQVVSASASYTNWGLLVRGISQIDCSSNPNAQSVLFNNSSGEPTIVPSAFDYGYIGISGTIWYQGYAQAWNALSRSIFKRDIVDAWQVSDLIMNDIRNLKPRWYKYKSEIDNFDENKWLRTRYNYHLGFFVEDLPDYVKDNTFSYVNLLDYASLALVGVKHVDERVQLIEKHVPVSEYGTGSVSSREARVTYSKEFQQLELADVPVVMITPTSSDAKYYVKNADKTGFTLVSENGPMTFNWVAMAKRVEKTQVVEPPKEILEKIRVPEDKKQMMMKFAEPKPQQTIPLLRDPDDDPSRHRTLRYNPTE